LTQAHHIRHIRPVQIKLILHLLPDVVRHVPVDLRSNRFIVFFPIMLLQVFTTTFG